MENEERGETLEVDETTSSSGDENTEENTGDESDLAEELERERQARQQLTARAKKAEEDLKALRAQMSSEKPEEKPETQSAPDVDERILKANGMPDELLRELKVVAQVRGVGLIEAQSDPIFSSLKDKYEKEQKASEAALGASKGSGQAKKKVDLKTPGLSREEHKALAKERLG